MEGIFYIWYSAYIYLLGTMPMDDLTFISKLRGDKEFRKLAKNYLFFYGSFTASKLLSKELRLDKLQIRRYLEYTFYKEYFEYLFKIKQMCLSIKTFRRSMRYRISPKFADYYNSSVSSDKKATIHILEEVQRRYFKK